MSRRGGGIIGRLTQGASLISEYREHRKLHALARDSVTEPSQTTSDQELPSVSGKPADQCRTAANSDPALNGHQYMINDICDSDMHNFSDVQHTGREDNDNDSGKCHMVETLHELDHKDAPPIVDEEEEWQLDELIMNSFSAPVQEKFQVPVHGNEVLLQVDIPTQPKPNTMSASRNPLPCPVIIPQRRPGNSSRGFVRAYAPVLKQCGIHQEVFLDFLKNFHQSSQADSVYSVISVTAGLASWAPSVTAMVVTTVAQIGAQTAISVQTRKRTNNYLDRANEELFKPAGLFCFIMKLTPEQEDGSSDTTNGVLGVQYQVADVNTHQIIAAYDPAVNFDASAMSSKWSSFRKSMRKESGTTHGPSNLMVSAPLIFPNLDNAGSHDGKESFKDKVKDANKFVASYLDHQTQAKYAKENQDSSLVMPEYRRDRGQNDGIAQEEDDMQHIDGQGFHTRLENGNNSEAQDGRGQSSLLGRLSTGTRERRGPVGSLIGLAINHGHVSSQHEPLRQYDGQSQQGFRDIASRIQSRKTVPQTEVQASKHSLVRRSVKTDVFYLMIVNMPSEMELQEAREAMQRE